MLLYGFLLTLLALGLLELRAVLRRRRSPAAHKPDVPDGAIDGTGWREVYLDGSSAAENAFIRESMLTIQTVQSDNKSSDGNDRFVRAFHAKQLGGIPNAVLHMLDCLPEGLIGGFLEAGATFEVVLRYSNASGRIQHDSKKDLRGVVLRIKDKAGKVLQEILLTNAPFSHVRDAREFVQFARAMAGSKLLLLPRLLWWFGPLGTIRVFCTVLKQASKPVTSLALESYFSRAAFACGDVAFQLSLEPDDSTDRTLTVPAAFKGYNWLSEDLIERLKRGPVTCLLKVRKFKSEKTTPIEDGTGEWKECDSPAITIGKLVIPQQDLTTPEAKAAAQAIDKDEFNPWFGFLRPLGSMNRARKFVYKSSADLRRPEEDGVWRPKSKRVGIGPWKYVWWNWLYHVLQWFNVNLGTKYRKVSWDKWPSWLGLLYLMAKLRFNRSNALTDPYDYKTNDNTPGCPAQPPEAKHNIAADGKFVSDDVNGQMGAAMTRFGSNIPPQFVRPDVEEMRPTARECGKLRWRLLDENGEEIVIPALIGNVAMQAWIQFEFHNFGGNTLRDPVNQNPHLLKRDPREGWPGDVAVVDRTTQDPTRVGPYDGRPTVLNEKVHAWVQGQIYGNSVAELARLRSGKDGKMALGANGMLLEDPARPGVDLTGFNNNYNPMLSFLHWLFTVEHNAICDHIKYFHPDWDDEQIFQRARKTNCAQISRIHTIQWTEDLLQHPTLQLGMHADWYGLLGQKLKLWLTRLCHRHKWLDWLLKPIRNNDLIWGMPGSKWEHHDGPFQVPKHFRFVYRLHEMVLGVHNIVEPGTNRLLDRRKLVDFVHENTRAAVEKFGYDTLGWSFVSASCGGLKAHNMARFFTQFKRMQDGTLIDLAELDLFRERTDGTGTFNEFRVSLGEAPVTSFMELTGGDAELARELEIKYEGDIDKVDAGIGILVEPKPDGFALGFLQFYQFVLNAPRRVKSNRFLSEGYTYEEYGECLDWIEHGGGIFGVTRRHLPKLAEQMEGVTRWFTPWKPTETFPLRQLMKCHEDTSKVFGADLRTLALLGVAGGAALWSGLTSFWVVALLLLLLGTGSIALAVTRMLAMRFMQNCQKKQYTDKRGFMFGELYRAEEWIERAACGGRWGSYLVMLGSGAIAWTLCASNPLVAGLFALVGLSALSIRKRAKAFAADAQVLKIALRNRMRTAQPVTDPAEVPSQAVDEVEVERLFRTYAPGREYFTAYDFSRMHEGERLRDAAAGRGNWFSRLWNQWKANRRSKQLLRDFADMVVEEDRALVPAVSRKMLVRVYQGVAQYDLHRERHEGNTDPSPTGPARCPFAAK